MTQTTTSLTDPYLATSAINLLAGNDKDPNDIDGLRRQCVLIRSEINEGMEHYPDLPTDPGALRDDICDILFTAYGLAHRLAMPSSIFEVPFETVHSDAVIDSTRMPHNAHHLLDLLMQRLDDIVQCINGHPVESSQQDLEDKVEALINHTWEFGWALGYPVEQDYQAVVASNWSKFDISPSDALDTQGAYLNIGVETTVTERTMDFGNTTQTFYIVRSTHDQTGTDGKEYPGGKWLKSKIGFREPVFDPL